MDPDFQRIPFKFLPISVRNHLADLLDPQTSAITMETFGERLNKYHNYSLGLTAPKLLAFRSRGQSATLILFNFLQSTRVTVGDVQFVLHEMGAASSDIFREAKFDIISNSNSNSRSVEQRCSCQHCHSHMANSTIRPGDANSRTQRLPQRDQTFSRLNRSNQTSFPSAQDPTQHPPQSMNNFSRPEQIGQHHPRVPSQQGANWSPPTCDCKDTDCSICELNRLQDPDETVVLSVHTGSQRTSNLSSQIHLNQMNMVDEVQENVISYSENPSFSSNLRGQPEGVSFNYSEDLSSFSKENKSPTTLRCTCRKPPVCTCNKTKVQRRTKPAVLHNRSDSNRWSTTTYPPDGSQLEHEIGCSSNTSSSTSSDPNLSQQSNRGSNRSSNADAGKKILISYTDDVKQKMIGLAQDLQGQGHTVNTDLHRHSFIKAKNEGLVREEDQYMWLRNKYRNADFVIVCTSTGYVECLNLQQACPSPQYLNARYIFELIMADSEKIDKVIEASFEDDRFCLDFVPKKFVLQRQKSALFDHLTLNY